MCDGLGVLRLDDLPEDRIFAFVGADDLSGQTGRERHRWDVVRSGGALRGSCLLGR